VVDGVNMVIEPKRHHSLWSFDQRTEVGTGPYHVAAAVYGGKANWPEAALRSVPGTSTCKRRLEDGATGDLSMALQTCSELGDVHERQAGAYIRPHFGST